MRELPVNCTINLLTTSSVFLPISCYGNFDVRCDRYEPFARVKIPLEVHVEPRDSVWMYPVRVPDEFVAGKHDEF